MASLFDDLPGETPPPAESPIVVGTSGYVFDDWKGPFYPADLPASRMLAYYAQFFRAVEINASYYRMLTAKDYAGMLQRTPPHFVFVTKMFGEVTHEAGLNPETCARYRDSLQPLREHGRLGAVLLQFPMAFRNVPEHWEKLERIREQFPELTLAVEFRHAGWIGPETFARLSELGLCYVSVDEPPLPGLVAPVAEATGPIGYVRWHGRNAAKWWGGGGDRYNYSYSDDELREWLPKLQRLLQRANTVYAFFNNCFQGQAAANAQRLQSLLDEAGMA